MSTRLCPQCHEPLPLLSRSDAVYCSTRCRVAALRARRAETPDTVLPLALRERARWVRHRAKRPITTRGRAASVTDARTWATFEAAASSTAGDGLGFVLDGDGIVCVDVDDCLSGGNDFHWKYSSCLE